MRATELETAMLREAKVRLDRVRWAKRWDARFDSLDFRRKAAIELAATVATWPETLAVLRVPLEARDWAVRDLLLPALGRLRRRLLHPLWGFRPAAWLVKRAERWALRRWPIRMRTYHAGALLNIRDLGIPEHIAVPGVAAIVFLESDGGIYP